MKLEQLKLFVKQGESEQVEFKKSTANLSTGMQTVCAFLNSDHGGVVIFGVADNGKIVGQKVADKTRKDIAAEINKLDPYEKIDIHYIPVSDDLYAIAFAVKPGENAPYMHDGRSFMRNQSTTVRMPREEFEYLQNKNNPTVWEKATYHDCTIKDLDHERIREVVRMAIFKGRLPETASNLSIPVILEKLELVSKDKLTNAAVILFCKNERKQFIQSNLRLARFKGIDKTEFINSKDLRANAFDIYDAAMDFLIYYLPVAARIEEGNPIRIETPAIPHKVLREAVTNALIHRDYSYEGGSMTIALYDDRVNITNIGALPKGIKLNQLTKEHYSMPRNPRIAHVFYLSGRIEKWGRGTLDMIQDCKKAGNPLPKFEEIGDAFSVTMPLKEPMRTVIYEKPSETVLSKLTDRQRAILDILEEGKLKTAQIKARLKGRFTERTLQLELTKLKQLGFVKSIGATKAKAWYLPHNM